MPHHLLSSSVVRGRGRRWFLGALVALACTSRGLLAAGPTNSSEFDEQLAAGEFAPALASAQKVEDPAGRDARLSELAQAQARSGARDSAFSTLAYIGDDRTRYSAVQSTQAAAPPAGARGGAQADFTSLMNLITSTVAPTTWDEVGGPGSMTEFRNGVYVDASGELKRAARTAANGELAGTRRKAMAHGNVATGDARHATPLRKVSLTRLEKYVQLTLAAGLKPNDEMLNLAGLEKIKYVLVYPETGDLVLAGPAGPWHSDAEGRHVSQTSGRPVLQLDDLVVVLRYLRAAPQATFGCSIEPTTEGLARTRQFAVESSASPIKPSERGAWLKKLRQQMGLQSIVVEGIDPRTRVARVLVEADYRMKLVGMGLEKGITEVPSYLDLIHVAPGQAPPPLDVLRWWFTLKYDAVHATPERDAFEIRGPGAQVLSENEHLTNLGQRVHTGKSEPLNQQFAERFTQHFADLAEKYPVYADLQNVFDLAMVSSLMTSENLADQVGWHMTCFADADQYRVALGPAPRKVETVINHRIIGGKHIVVGVSGGVLVSPWQFVSSQAIETDTYGALRAEQRHAKSEDLPMGAWWWD
jgi:hypothetical protein